MIIRPLKVSDREIFLSLCQDFYNANATNRPYDDFLANKTFDYLLHEHENLWGYLIQDDKNDYVGYALITSYWCNEDGGNVVILDELYVSPLYRHHGFAKLFLDWIENEFKDKAVAITLEVLTSNQIAKELYVKAGYYEDGFEVLTKRLL